MQGHFVQTVIAKFIMANNLSKSNASVMERYGKLKDHDRSFDIQFWQAQEPKIRMDAAWEMIIHAYRVKGTDVRKLRLDKTVELFQRQTETD